MKSMTGFGRGTHATDHFSINVELKTVNNRFLDVNLRLPGELRIAQLTALGWTDARKGVKGGGDRGRPPAGTQTEPLRS